MTSSFLPSSAELRIMVPGPSFRKSSKPTAMPPLRSGEVQLRYTALAVERFLGHIFLGKIGGPGLLMLTS